MIFILIRLGRECVKKAREGLINQNEIIDLLEELNDHTTREAIFCYHIDKIECDFQAKIYDLNKNFDLEYALEDIAFFGKDGEEIKKKVKTANDVWIEYDKRLYKDDKIFESLINDIQNIKKNE